MSEAITTTNKAVTITLEMVREALRSHCKKGKRISNAELCRIFNLESEIEKNRLRARLNDMVNKKELLRVGSALYEYNFKYIVRKNTTFPVIWRFVRMQKNEWAFADVCQLTRISYSQVKRYCEWLENEEYIVRYGRAGATITYRATDKADKTPETPYPTVADKNPFERENAAAAELARLMLCHDPYQPTTVRKIVAACRVIQARFDRDFNQVKNGGKENEHC